MFEHLERKISDDWLSNCRNVEVTGVKSRGRRRRGENVFNRS
jgi:hypothetical protein